MDRFFLILMLVTGEEDGEGFNIHHILWLRLDFEIEIQGGK